MNGTILTAIDEAVATLTFHNPERRNSMSLQMWADATTALERFADDPAVRVVVLTGAGTASFVSGADISEFERVRGDAAASKAYEATLERFWQVLGGHPKPTIARIHGFCMGGGVNIAAYCDLRVCGSGSRFAIPAAKLGLGYAMGGLRRLVALVGPQGALEMLLTARQFTAAEALAMRLVHQVVDDAAVEGAVRELAQGIAANAPLTIRAAKRGVQELLADQSVRDLEACERLVRACFDSDDYKEGRRAFQEKRRPVFTGR